MDKSLQEPLLRLWFFGDSVLFVDDTPLFYRNYFNLQNKSLEVTMIGPEVAGKYTCRLSDPKESTLVHQIELLGPPVIETDVDELTAREGGNILIHCKSSSAPEPTITYAKEGSDVDLSPFVQNSTLRISGVTREHAGAYTCTAKNGYEPDGVKTVIVKYEGRPDVNVSIQWKNLQDEQKKGVELTCKVASEENATISWRKGDSDKLVGSPEYEILTENAVSVLRINSISKELFDNYTCVASNQYGETSGIVEISSAPIKPTVKVTPSDVKAEIAVSTASPYRVRKFELTLKGKVGEPRQFDLALSETEPAGANGKYELKQALTQLTPDSDYEGTVVAITEKDERSAPEKFTFHTEATQITSGSAQIAGCTLALILAFTIIQA
ncbi:hemicentin-2-like [Tropilaelaps mercedesae]|uniref:Hemicentin-2-like n=1 Tax=Tropilaelaps mercedesae TaxID=418985 RepID=A0A1V9X5A9_9ACAR|nr:hemicentin-2-like [Tropilaelaps mercedesae]